MSEAIPRVVVYITTPSQGIKAVMVDYATSVERSPSGDWSIRGQLPDDKYGDTSIGSIERQKFAGWHRIEAIEPDEAKAVEAPVVHPEQPVNTTPEPETTTTVAEA